VNTGLFLSESHLLIPTPLNLVAFSHPALPCLIVERDKTVHYSLYSLLSFLDSFLRSMKIEQAELSQPGAIIKSGGSPTHAAAVNPYLHDIDAGGQHIQHGEPSRLRTY
jgi:hypothetical protein